MDNTLRTSKTHLLIRVFVFFILLGVAGLATALVIQAPQKRITVKVEPTGMRQVAAPVSTEPTKTVVTLLSAKQLLSQTYGPLLHYAQRTGELPTSVSTGSDSTPLDKTTILKLNTLADTMRTTGTSYIQAEVVMLWFNNYSPETYNLEQRRSMAAQYMNALRERVASGQLTMEQAGLELRNDQTLKDIDRAWQTNAYRKISYAKKDIASFSDPIIEQLFWTMQTGDLSPVLTSRMMGAPNSPEAAFLIIQVNTHQEKEYESYRQFTEANK